METVIDLHPDERVLGIIRRSLWAEWHRICFSIVWVLLPFFFFFPLISLGGFGLIVFAALLVSGIFFALKSWIIWRHTILIATDHRIIDAEQMGFFEREATDLVWSDVDNVAVIKSGILKRIWKIGKVRIEAAKNNSFDLELSGVRFPEKVRDFLIEVQCMLEEASDRAKEQASNKTSDD